jgi:hypothetical protein
MLNIDSEFESLIPPLTPQEYEQLKENILADGCRDALVIWNGTVIDGHNRHRICTENGIEFKTVGMEFDSREDAIIWICKNQTGRRNITDEQKSYLLGKQYEAGKKIVARDNSGRFAPCRHNDATGTGRTSERIAAEMGVGKRTVERAGVFSKAVDALSEEAPEIKPMILSGQVNLPKKTIVEIAAQDAPERARSIKDIKEGRKPVATLKPRTDKPAPTRAKPDDGPNEATRYLSDLSRVEGMNTPDREAQRMCNDIRNSINLLMYAMKDVTFSELSPEVRQEVEESANRMDGVIQLIRAKLKGEKA